MTVSPTDGIPLGAVVCLAMLATNGGREMEIPRRDASALLDEGWAVAVGEGQRGVYVRATGAGVDVYRHRETVFGELAALNLAAGREYLRCWREGRAWNGELPEQGVLRLVG